jgi:Zn-dependent membrane protease YugP
MRRPPLSSRVGSITYVGAMFIDPMYLLIVAPAMVLAFVAQAMTKGRFAKYAEVPSQRGLSGAETARYILDRNGLRDVPVEVATGFLSDHYDPASRTVRLSPEVFHGRSVSSVAVAAHEVGHAIQHKEKYGPLALRAFTVPLASFGSNFAFILFAIGLAMQMFSLAWAGVFLFGGVVFFQLVTLPVEFDASARAKRILLEDRLVTQAESGGISKVLNAAALTYVAAALTSILTLLYFVLRLTSGQRRD